MKVETFTFDDDGAIPNSSLPVLLYRRALGPDAGAAAHEELFADNGWLGAWRNGIYPFHHFHSTSHEVLGIASGTANVVLGGPQGSPLELTAGDVVVLPAGTGHCNAGS
ncbi:MAG: cupin, partial [Solirubrobacterales bacterium]